MAIITRQDQFAAVLAILRILSITYILGKKNPELTGLRIMN